MTKSTTHALRHQGPPTRPLQLERLDSEPLLSGAALIFSILFLLMLQTTAWAQTSAQGRAQDTSLPDPSGSIARLNLFEGSVAFLPANGYADAAPGAPAWTPAVMNRPLTTGDRLWVGPQSRAELHLGSTAVRMSGQTSLDLLTLDDSVTQIRLGQGAVKLRVRNLYGGQRLEVDTPNLAFVISQPGDYRLDVNPAANTTRVVSQSGSGEIYGASGASVNLGNQQQVTFAGTNLAPAGLGAASFDTFDHWSMARDQAEDRSVTARYVPRETVGYQQLDSYGDWTQDANYGAVWLPRAVPANWAPYRVGHWNWISPWGWTWIDDAPWGFAPFHYGRWAQIGPRWGWVPGQLAARPVYAPALVAFVGGGSGGGLSWNVSIDGGSRPALGWFPLAPGEAFRPAYHASPRYVTQVNQNIIVNNIVNQTNATNVYRYARTPTAVTAASATDFVHGGPVASNVRLTAADLGRAQLIDPVRGMPQRPADHEMREIRNVREARPAINAVLSAPTNSRPAVNVQGVLAATPLNTAPAPTGTTLAAPAWSAAAQQGKRAQDARSHTQFEARQQRQANNTTTTTTQPGKESLGQRALLEQAQRNAVPSQETAKTNPRAAPDRNADNSIEQARRTQQQLQRDQQRQQRELVHQQNEQRRQSEELLGQRAQREQAVARQQQAKEQADANKRVQDQKARQPQPQPQPQPQIQKQQTQDATQQIMRQRAQPVPRRDTPSK